MALWKRDNTWWADVTVNGRRYRESLKTSDKREAKSLEKELCTAIQAGKVGSPSGKAYARLPFDRAAEIYVDERVGRVAERTTQFERERLVPLGRHLRDCPLSKLTPERIARYQQARIADGVSGRTINMEISVLRRMLKKAKLWAPIAEDVKLYPETSHIGRALTVEEKKRLFATAMSNPRWNGCALRRGSRGVDHLSRRRAEERALEARRSVRSRGTCGSEQERVGS